VFKHFVGAVALALVVPTGAWAQPARPSAAIRDAEQARYNLFMMEGVLERSVENGADRLRRQVRRIMPDMLLMSGAAQARGFRLEGYGVFFDVEVPVLRRSVAWSLRTMIDENGVAASTALQQLKALVETVTDPRQKANYLQAIKRIELQVGPVTGGAPGAPSMARPQQRDTVTAASVDPVPPQPEAAPAPPQPPAISPADEALITNPSEVYEREVVSALIDAMLDYSGSLAVGPEEWLTVAARDNEHRDRLMPNDAYDLMTIVLRVKGSDLAAFRGDRITKEEARKRVEVREF
jgi:hypothetical protein